MPTAVYGQDRLSIPSTVQKSTVALGINDKWVSARLEKTEVVMDPFSYFTLEHTDVAAFCHSPSDTLNLLREGRDTTNKVNSRQTSHKSSVGYQVSAQINL